MKDENYQKIDPILWLVLCVIILLFGITAECGAQKQQAVLDTVQCKPECIVKYVTSQTKSGNTTYKAIYIDKQNGVEEIIPISKSVWQYISDCKTNGIKPQLGIKLKNGEISAIIRLKTKYRRVKR